MKRIIPFIILGVVVVVLAIGGGAAGLIYYWLTREKPAVPFKEDELIALVDNPKKAEADLPRIIACFEVDDDNVRVQAAEVLKNIGPKAVEPLRAKLKDKNAQVRFWTVQSLALIGPPAADATPDLLPLLKDDDSNVRYKTVYAIGKLGVKSDAVFEGLLNALSDKDESVVETAVESLKQMDTPPAAMLPKLTELARGQNLQVRMEAIRMLGTMGEPAVPAFQELLKRSDAVDREAIIPAIAGLGPKATPLLPELQAIMIREEWWEPEEALFATFKKCGPDGAKTLANVLKSLQDPKTPHFMSSATRTAAVLKAIGAMGADGKHAVPVMIEVLKERDTLRPQVLEALGDIGPAAKEAIPAVEALVNNDTPRDDPARVALRRMGKIGGQ